MNIREIAANIAEKYGVDGLESKDGKIELKIDGAAVMIEETDGDVFIFNGIIGDAPSDGAETFAQILLESNLVMMNSRAVALAHNADTQAYVLIERVPVKVYRGSAAEEPPIRNFKKNVFPEFTGRPFFALRYLSRSARNGT